ncbi:DUF4129 domain-containing protein [Winogradskyella maritima]|uniref:DUF4129 domain-containing protein n=1 Tax=Winogradskyella maritima TaxID=1517766 RepID=A0ABV8AIX2_9FLAO|nr:DUF4129 domain-containing protein [Winogradskyella maritima]
MLRLTLVLCFVCLVQFSFGQDTLQSQYYDTETFVAPEISEDDLKNYKADDDFNYVEVEPEDNLWTKFKRWLRNILTRFWEAIFGVGTAEGFLYFMLKVVPWILLALLLFLLIKFFLRVNSNNAMTLSRNKGSISLSEEEEIIKNEDIPALIKEAINQNNFRLAIRYYYLLSLKKLSENETIEWQPQKTNSDYLNEIETPLLKTHFKNITRIYDYVWYGEFEVNALKFETLKLPFLTLQNDIKS